MSVLLHRTYRFATPSTTEHQFVLSKPRLTRFVKCRSALGRAEAVPPQTRGQGEEQRPSVAGMSNYRRREPEKSLLHETVRAHLKTFVAEIEQDGSGLPHFVVAEFERYLRCGILAHGFARVRCIACGDELFVPSSCKSRGICPSCTTRRMQGTATHLVDRVLPCVPMRQWVLSLPRWARFLLARDPALITRTLHLACAAS